MLDYMSAATIFLAAIAATQEWLLKYRLGYHGRYWTVAFALSLFVSFFVCAIPSVLLIVSDRLDLFSYPGNSIFLSATTVIFTVFLWLGQWIILRQQETTPRVFALLNTAVAILTYFVLVRLNISSVDVGGGPIQGWKTSLIFLVAGTVTGAVTGKVLDFYCEREEQRLLRLERERVEKETLERKRIQREAAQEEERLWYEKHGRDYQDYEYDEDDEEDYEDKESDEE